MHFQRGDRVRIKNPSSEYTGCRGTIAEETPPGVTALGHHVAIDGENGVARPFLTSELEPIRVARVRARSTSSQSQQRDESGGSPGE
jgi:hypothetical protein